MYCLDEYLKPIWQGNIVYDESVMVVKDSKGNIPLQPLAYDAKRIISVKNAMLTKEYTEGVDYLLADGKVKILDNGSIFIMDYDEYFPKSDENNKVFATDDGFTIWREGAFLHERQIVVTYEHEISDMYFPSNQKSDLSINEKLRKKENISLVFYGDSITFGWNSSEITNTSPYLPLWGKLTALGIKDRYGYDMVILENEDFSGSGNIKYINTAVSGTSALWGLENVQERVCKYKADMVFLAFGMNNPKMDPDAFKDTLCKMIYEIRKDNPSCSIVLVATTHPNPYIVCTRGHREAFVPALYQIKDELGNIAVSDMTTLHYQLLLRKPYHHMTGNNINHPNDFLMRQYAIMTLHSILD
ncbi:MAG TPA: SGNH/GDSL hydrolase family protein [Clostridia bacterium]|jgi:lysophospholipase L1-like esterase|nr:MAG: hypothetical protein BWX97_00398 [Firmicutes bacterium ADurb.Bin146]HOD93720.1 SGNH/GDSL hydrolase family protein [Clostridia bacterium]HQM39906.1 SGNH/GDSL hydrolase family protein [Clostridia bacterium]